MMSTTQIEFYTKMSVADKKYLELCGNSEDFGEFCGYCDKIAETPENNTDKFFKKLGKAQESPFLNEFLQLSQSNPCATNRNTIISYADLFIELNGLIMSSHIGKKNKFL